MRFAPLVPKPKPSPQGKRGVQRKPNFALSNRIMAKLEVGDVNDPLEREADVVADRVMRAPAPRIDAPDVEASEVEADSELDEEAATEALVDTAFAGGAAVPPRPGAVARRECSACDSQEDELRRKAAEERHASPTATDELRRACTSCEDEEVRREAAAGERGGVLSDDLSARVRDRICSGGVPLSDYARNFLEPRLGVDLSYLRVHTDADAGMLARWINARAFTLGKDVFFAPGEWRPHTSAGMRLLAHEVAHTLQGSRSLAGPAAGELAMRACSACEDEDKLQRAWAGRRTAKPALFRSYGSDDSLRRSPEGCELGPDPGVTKNPFMAPGTSIDLRGVFDLYNLGWVVERLRTKGQDGERLAFKYGDLAAGSVPLVAAEVVHQIPKEIPTSYWTKFFGEQAIEVSLQSEFRFESKDELAYPLKLVDQRIPQAGRDALALYVHVEDGKVSGFVAKNRGPIQVEAGKLASLTDVMFNLDEWPSWIGIEGAEEVSIAGARFRNSLRDGALDFSLEGFAFQTGGLLASKGNYAFHSDGTPEFAGCVRDEVEGLGPIEMPLDMLAPGNVLAQQELSINGDFAGFTGNLLITYSNGLLTATGTADFKGDEFEGTVMLALTTAEEGYRQLQALVSTHHADATLTAPEATDPDELGLIASGILDFHIDDWLQGSVSVFVGPDGEITAAGVWQPSAEVRFLDPKLMFPEDGPMQVLPPTEVVEVPVPYFPGVFASVWAEACAYGLLGPGRLHSLRAKGVVSTADYIPPSLQVGGAVEMQGQGSFCLGVYGSLSAAPHDWGVAELRLGVEGQAHIPVRVEADQDFALYGSSSAQEDGRRFDAFVEGTLEGQGGLVVKLNGDVALDTLMGELGANFGEFYLPVAGGEILVDYRSELGGETEITAQPSFALGEVSPDLVIQEIGSTREDVAEDADELWGDEPEPDKLPDFKPLDGPHADFKMQGKPHSMYLVDPIDSDPVVLMESERDVLRNKIEARREAIALQDPGMQHEGELSFLEYIEHQVSVVEKNAKKTNEQKPYDGEWAFDPKTLGFDLLVELVSDYGQLFDKTDIAGGSVPPGDDQLKQPAGSRTRWNPEGLRTNCGFCVISFAYEVKTKKLETAAEFYDRAREEMSIPDQPISHWLLMWGQRSEVEHSQGAVERGVGSGIKQHLKGRASEWNIQNFAQKLAGISFKTRGLESKELADMAAINEGGGQFEAQIAARYDDYLGRLEESDDPREQELLEELQDDDTKDEAEARVKKKLEKSLKDKYSKGFDGDYFSATPVGGSRYHFQYLRIGKDLGLTLYDPQISNSAIATDHKAAAALDGGRFLMVDTKAK